MVQLRTNTNTIIKTYGDNKYICTADVSAKQSDAEWQVFGVIVDGTSKTIAWADQQSAFNKAIDGDKVLDYDYSVAI